MVMCNMSLNILILSAAAEIVEAEKAEVSLFPYKKTGSHYQYGVAEISSRS